MEAAQTEWKRKGTSLAADKSSRMSEPPRARIYEDLGSDFAGQNLGNRRGGSRGFDSRRAQKKKGEKNTTELLDDDESEDELDLLSQTSKDRSPLLARATTRVASPEAGRTNGIMIDGTFHRFHENYRPKPAYSFSFKKNKSTDTAADTTLASSTPPHETTVSASTSSEANKVAQLRRPNKVLGMLPISGRTPGASSLPPSRDAGLELTPRPVKSLVQTCPQGPVRSESIEIVSPPRSANPKFTASKTTKGKAKAQPFPMEDTSPLELSSSETLNKSSNESRAKPQAEDFPMHGYSPLKEESNQNTQVGPRNRATEQLPMLLRKPLKPSQPRTRSPQTMPKPSKQRIAPFPMGGSSPVRLKNSQESTTRSLRPRKAKGSQSRRVASESEPDSDQNMNSSGGTKSGKHKGKQLLQPFPMQSQIPSRGKDPLSPGKRGSSSDGSTSTTRERKRAKGADDSFPEISFLDESDDEDLLFFNPNTDPSALCSWCDELLPPTPSRHLQNLIAAARARSSYDARPTNPLGLYAPPTVFVNVCQRHRFESVQIPLAKKRGWPTRIDWASLGGRIYALRDRLQHIVDDVDEDFLPGNERSVDSFTEVGEDAKDDSLLLSRLRKGSVFWKEVIKGVRKKGSMKAAGVGGQMSSFSKTQPGYYGEQGYMIMNQTIYDLFPPADFPSDSTLPLTPAEFIQRVLVPEAAVSLVMEDLQLSRQSAIDTLRESASYGVAMFPDDHAEGPSMTAGEQIVRKRATARRQELEQEDREEEDLWAALSEPPSGSECSARTTTGKGTSRARSKQPEDRTEEAPRSSRARRQCAGRVRTMDLTDSEDDVTTVAGDTEYMPAKNAGAGKSTKWAPVRSQTVQSRRRASSKASDTKSSDVEEVLPTSQPSRPRPRPRPRSQATDAERSDYALEVDRPMQSSGLTVRMKSTTIGMIGHGVASVHDACDPIQSDVEATPNVRRRSPNQEQKLASSLHPLQMARERFNGKLSTPAMDANQVWSYRLMDACYPESGGSSDSIKR